MRNSRRKGVQARKKRWRAFILTFGILICVYLTLTLALGENGLLRYFKLKAVRNEMQAGIKNIERQNKEVRRQVDLLKKEKDPNMIEELAREQGLTKEDEIVYKFPQQE
ncbi:MAG: septum formation initiator family protein [Nitrospirae bacterium]|nr:septum formation initiator family protein [Nitrospirota bacterium]